VTGGGGRGQRRSQGKNKVVTTASTGGGVLSKIYGACPEMYGHGSKEAGRRGIRGERPEGGHWAV